MHRHCPRKVSSEFSSNGLEYLREEVDLIDWDWGMDSRDYPRYRNRSILDINWTPHLSRQRKQQREALQALEQQEEMLQETVKKLTLAFYDANKKMVEKLEETRGLEKIISKLRLKREKGGRDHEVRSQASSGTLNDAFPICSEQVWKHIFERVGNWKDLQSCSQFSTAFQKSIRPHIAITLFSKFFPPLYKYLEGSEILLCRMVCKAWTAGVDHFLENHESLRPHNLKKNHRSQQFPSLGSPMQEKGIGSVYFSNKGVEAFILRTLTCLPLGGIIRDRNPFIGRAVIISNGLQHAEQFLQIYGKHIWYITAHGLGRSSDDHLLSLVTIQQPRLLPNLRKLVLIGFDNALNTPNTYIPVESLSSTPKLETLEIDNVYRRHSFAKIGGEPRPTHLTLTSMLRKHHLQLGRLHVRVSDLLFMTGLDWPNLTELHVLGLVEPCNGNYLRLLQVVMPNLQKLCFSDFEFTVDQLVNITNMLSSTTNLNTLRLARGIILDVEGRHGLVNLASPTLRVLEVEHCRQPRSYAMRSLSFLSYFPFLEKLHVYWRAVSDPKEMTSATRNLCLRSLLKPYPHGMGKAIASYSPGSEILQIEEYLYTGEMSKSNIWTVIPNLKEFTFQLALDTTDLQEKLHTHGSFSFTQAMMMYGRLPMVANLLQDPTGNYIYRRNVNRAAWRGLQNMEKELKWHIKYLTRTLAEANSKIVEKVNHADHLSRKISALTHAKKVEYRPVSNSSIGNVMIMNKATLFPEEIWEMVLKNLTDLTDLENSSNACVLFERILRPMKTTFLFRKIFPHLYKNLGRKEILGCRLTCTAWSHGVDDFFENHKFFQPCKDKIGGCDSRYPSFVNPVVEKKLNGLYANKWTRYVYRQSNFHWMQIPYSGIRNPFIGRNLMLDGHYSTLETCLQTYGEHIYYLNCDISHYSVALNLNLSLLPNLRRIRLARYNGTLLDATHPCLLPALTTIQLGIDTSFSQHTDIFLQRYRIQLERLDLTAEQWGRICHLHWPSLSELHLSVTYWCRVVSVSTDTILQGKLPNLQKLGLPSGWMRNGEIVEVIAKVSAASRLHTVRFEKLIWGPYQIPDVIVYAPPTLKTIEIELNPYNIPMEDSPISTFLLRFPFVENLSVFCKESGNRETRDSEDSQLVPRRTCFSEWKRLHKQQNMFGIYHEGGLELSKYMFVSKMFKSNIWELLPRLKVFTFQNHVYTRERYDWLKGQNDN